MPDVEIYRRIKNGDTTYLVMLGSEKLHEFKVGTLQERYDKAVVYAEDTQFMVDTFGADLIKLRNGVNAKAVGSHIQVHK
jgi:hypothetical protein